MATQVLGVVNIAYLFALSQFFMAWIIALALRARGRRASIEMARRSLTSPCRERR